LSALPASNFAIPHEVAVYGCPQLDRELDGFVILENGRAAMSIFGKVSHPFDDGGGSDAAVDSPREERSRRT
jgi:hypothetical protein